MEGESHHFYSHFISPLGLIMFSFLLLILLRLFLTAIVAVVLLLIGLAMAARNGYYIFQIFDDYSATIPLLVIALFQCIAVSWVYGNDR